VPNIYPYKEELMNALERKEKMEEEEKQRLKATLKGDKKKAASIEGFIQEVKGKVERFEEDKKIMYGGLTEEEFKEAERLLDPNAKSMQQSKKAYVRELKKVVEQADVVLEVLDARDPEGCRNKELEAQIASAGKKVILVVNKIDLVPPQNARMWEKYLRREFPTVLFKCN